MTSFSQRTTSWLVIAAALLVSWPAAEVYAAPGVDARAVAREAKRVAKDVVKWRRHLHAHPELSNRERKTAAYVVGLLKKMGVDAIKTGVARHGVVALIRGKRPGKTVALRADMDALPIVEASGVPFTSKNRGVMHACGHDAHTAVLLGATRVLTRMRGAIHGQVKLIFQPAEEGPPPGEKGGAKQMVAEGVLTKPRVDAIFALHTFPSLAAGKVGYTLGGAFASVDRFQIVVRGKQVHAAYPWKGRDPVVAAAHIVTGLQTIASRITDARDPIVVSVGIVKGGTRWNIIPGQVILEGTVRTHNTAVRKRAQAVFRRIVTQTAKAHGASAEIRYQAMAPVTWNNHALGRRMIPSLVRSVGAANVAVLKPTMGGEDFAFYARKIPGFYIRLGVRNPAIGAVASLHTPKFKIDEAALEVGVRTMSLMALDYLASKSRGK